MRAHFVLMGDAMLRLPHTALSWSRSTRAARRLVADRRGANMVEYVILVGMVALIAFAGFKYFGSTTRAKIDQQGDAIQGVNGAAQ